MSFGQELKDFVAAFGAGNKMGMDWRRLDLDTQKANDESVYRHAQIDKWQRDANRKDGAEEAFNSGRQGYLGVPSGAGGRTSSSGMAPDDARALVKGLVQKSGYVGLVPSDGAKFGIKTGSVDEWTNFWTGLAAHESGLDNGNVGDANQFPGGSRGLLQLSTNDAPNYGLNQGKPFSYDQLADPETNVASALAIGKSLLGKYGTISGGLGSYWGPISKEGWTPGKGRDASLPWDRWNTPDAQTAQAFAGGGLVGDDDEDPEKEPDEDEDDVPTAAIPVAAAPAAPTAPAAPPAAALPPLGPAQEIKSAPVFDATQAPAARPAAPTPPAQTQRTALPDGRMASDAGHGLAIADGDNSGHYTATGGGSGNVFSSLGAALDGGLRFLQSHFNLPQRGGIYDDAQRDRQVRFLRGEGAATPQEYSEVRRAVDPDGRYNDAVANIAGLTSVYEYYLKRGESQKAQSAAASLIQYTRGAAAKLGGMALDAKSPEEAAKLIAKGYDQIPDGKHIEVKPGPNGTGTFTQIDTRTGKVVFQGQYTPQQLLAAATKLKDGSAYWDIIMQAARGTKEDVDPKADEYVRSLEAPTGGAQPQQGAIPAAPAPSDAPAQQPQQPQPQQQSALPAPAAGAQPQADAASPTPAAPRSAQAIPAPQYQTPGAKPQDGQNLPAGMIAAGNIDLNNRPKVTNSDGSVSTVRSMSFEENGQEILVPTVSDDGKLLTDAEAIEQYHRTGRFLGKFKDPDSATAYAEQLHLDQEKQYAPAGGPQQAPGAQPQQGIPTDADPEPQPPAMPPLSQIGTTGGRQMALQAYQIRRQEWAAKHADWAARQKAAAKANAPAKPPRLDDWGKAHTLSDAAFEEWNASRQDENGKPLPGADPITPQGKVALKSLAEHLLTTNKTMSPTDALSMAYELMRVDADNPDSYPFVAAQKERDGTVSVRFSDGAVVSLDGNAITAMERARGPKVKAAKGAIETKRKQKADSDAAAKAAVERVKSGRPNWTDDDYGTGDRAPNFGN